MGIKSFFEGKKEVVLTPDDFKGIIVASMPNMTEKYNLGKIFLAECYERELAYYPVVVMKLSAKDKDQVDYACFIPQTAKVEIWSGKLSYRKLGCRDVAHKMELLVDDKIIDGKIVMSDGGLGFRFRMT